MKIQPVPFEWKKLLVPGGTGLASWTATYEPGQRDKRGRLIGYSLNVAESPNPLHAFYGYIWQTRDVCWFGRPTASVGYDSLEEAQADVLALAEERLLATLEKEGTG